MEFAKLKARLRAASARTLDALWKAIDNICNLFSPAECWNYLKAAGYVSDKKSDASSSRLFVTPGVALGVCRDPGSRLEGRDRRPRRLPE